MVRQAPGDAPTPAPLRAALTFGLAAASVLCILVPLLLALARIPYPFHLEWMEDGSLEQVRRLLAGKPLYAPPSLEFVSFIYTPLYFYVSALFARLMSPGFAPLRLVSLLATAGAMGVIYATVRRESRDRFAGLVAVGLFAAAYRKAGAWFDVARPDTLFLFLLLWGCYVARGSRSYARAVLAGLLFALAFHAKQTAVIALGPIALGAVLVGGKRGITAVATTLAIVVLGTLALDQVYHGWYRWFVFDLPHNHRQAPGMLVKFWTEQLAPFGIAGVLCAFHALRLAGEKRGRDLAWFMAIGAGLIGVSWAGAINLGWYKNVLLPGCAFLGLGMGLAIADVRAFADSESHPVASGLVTLVLLLGLLQFASLAYSPLHQLPRREDRAAGEALVRELRNTPGEVLFPSNSAIAEMAGKRPSAHEVAVEELLGWFGGGNRGDARAWQDSLVAALAARRYSVAINTNSGSAAYRYADWAREYAPARPVFRDSSVFIPVTGARIRAETWYEPYERMSGSADSLETRKR